MSKRRRIRHQPTTGGRLLTLPLLAAIIVAAGVGFAASSAYTASNSVPATNIGQYATSIGPSELQPAGCRTVLGNTLTTLVNIASGGSYQPATAVSNTLILGTSGNETIKTASGSGNCTVGGAGTDSVSLKAATNQVCILDAASIATQKGCTTTITSP